MKQTSEDKVDILHMRGTELFLLHINNAMLAAKGYTVNAHLIYYDEVFALVPNMRILRAFLYS